MITQERIKNPPLTHQRLLHFLIVTTLVKWSINTGKKILYAFAPAISRGLGIPASTVTALIALNQTTALFIPWVMAKTSGYGYRNTALAACALAVTAFLSMGLFPFHWVVIMGLIAMGLAKSVIDPTLQAMVGEYIPCHHQGKSVGIMEISWAMASLVGIPMCGYIIQATAWQTPFLVLALITIVGFWGLLKVLPQGHTQSTPTPPDSKEWKDILSHPQILSLLIYSFFICLANENFFVTYGFWLENHYGLSLAAIGMGTAFIGAAEFLGEMLMAFLADRFGIVKTLFWSTFFSALSFFALLALDTELFRALAGLFIVFFSFEFSYVTSMGLSTQLKSQHRGTLLAIFFSIRGLGRVAGALSGGYCWTQFGITGVCEFSAIITFGAVLALAYGFYIKKEKQIAQ